MATNNFEGLGDETLHSAQSIKRTMDEIRDSVTRTNRALQGLGDSTGKYSDEIKAVANSAKKVADIQESALKTSKATAKALEEQSKQGSVIRTLTREIDELYARSSRQTGELQERLKQQAQHLSNARDNARELSSLYGSIARDASKLNSQTKFFNKLSEVAKSIPALNKFATPFEKAAEAAKKVALNNAKVVEQQRLLDKLGKNSIKTGKGLTKEKLEAAGVTHITGGLTGTAAAQKLREHQEDLKQQKKSPFIEGAKVAGGEMVGTLTSMASITGIISAILKFILDIFLGVNRQVVQIAQNLNISTQYAEQMRDHYAYIATHGNSILMDTQSLIDAQIALVDSLGVYSKLQDSTLRNQVFFTKNLNMSAEAAAGLNLMLDAQGQNAETVTDQIVNTNNKASKTTGILLPTNKLMSQIGKTSKEIAGYFGFNAKAMAEGVRQVVKFGLELENAKSVASALLDFESSIANELQLELLTGKELSMEKARVMAVTGDIAGATGEVMKQMQNLTEEQRKNPLIMEAMAASSGLTADQINRAYLVNKKLNKEQKDYVKQLQDAGREKEANAATDAALHGRSVEQIKATVTAQDAFAAALTKVKDKLATMVDNGVLDKFTQIIEAFVNTISKSGIKGLFNGDFSDELVKVKTAEITQGHATASKGMTTSIQKAKLADIEDRASGAQGINRYTGQAVKEHRNTEDVAQEDQQKNAQLLNSIKSGEIKVDKNGNLQSEMWDKLMNIQQQHLDLAKGQQHTSIYIGANSLAESLGVYSNKVGN